MGTKLPRNCKAYYRGGSYYCDYCGTTWDYNDPEPPECSSKTVKNEEMVKIKKILNYHD